jgi:hypothetical protein
LVPYKTCRLLRNWMLVSYWKKQLTCPGPHFSRKRGVISAPVKRCGFSNLYGKDDTIIRYRILRVRWNFTGARPETEHLVEHAKQYITSLPVNSHILEIGTGTGCISVTLADEFLHTYSFEATDNDAYALHLAHFNAKLHNVEDNIRLVRRDLLRKGPHRSPHVIIANLPYLDAERHSDDSIKKEPASHLYSSVYGRGHYRRLFRELSRLSSFRECPLFGEALPEDMEALQNEAKRIWGDTGEFEQCDSFVFKLNVRA